LSALDEVLPEYRFAERHEVRADVAPERLLAAARAVTLAELPLVRLLFRLRGLGHGLDAAATILDAMGAEGFEALAEEPGRELVVAAVGRPWSLRGGLRRGEDFATFAEPGWAKMALSIRVEADGRLVTETRVHLTDAAAARRFRPYWLVVRPFSGLVRRLWLRAAVRRARATAGGEV
jgi:hypothetical protein